MKQQMLNISFIEKKNNFENFFNAVFCQKWAVLVTLLERNYSPESNGRFITAINIITNTSSTYFVLFGYSAKHQL